MGCAIKGFQKTVGVPIWVVAVLRLILYFLDDL